MTATPISEGKSLIQSWTSCRRQVENHRRSLLAAENDLKEAEQRLSKWMLPDDVSTGEKIAVWWEDSLIQVEVLEHRSDGNHVVRLSMRLRGKHGLEQGL